MNLWSALVSLALFLVSTAGLNSDGTKLLAFKYSILSDPLSALATWTHQDPTPCAWNGVVCAQIGISGSPEMLRVTGVVLPGNQLLGSISPYIALIDHLRNLNLSGNFFNGSLPETVFNAAELEVLDLGSNVISGELPETLGGLRSLRVLNLADNAFSGRLPENLTDLRNLTVVSLRSNYFSGGVPVGFGFVEELDLSSNLLNGSLPVNFSGEKLGYFNCSYNKISGPIPPQFATNIPENATVDLSFNNLTGAIPETLQKQKTEAFAGNGNLCGKPVKTQCSIPSTLSTPPNTSTASPAIAVVPKSPEPPHGEKQRDGMKPLTIAGIAVADFAGIALLSLIVLYFYKLRRKKILKPTNPTDQDAAAAAAKRVGAESKWYSCLPIHGGETSEAEQMEGPKRGSLVTVDGETELEAEKLFTASAYVLGSSWSGIVYRAVLDDGTAVAVRRIGAEVAVRKMKDFESQVKAIAKLRHPNLVRVLGFYLGEDEKLLIHDFVSNGSLAAIAHRKMGSSPIHMSLEVRLKIARGVARGLTYIHDKKIVHGNVKPSNILLNLDMEPLISDLGLNKLVSGQNSHSTREAGIKRFKASEDTVSASRSPYVPEGSSKDGVSPYRAPESFKNLKPSPKWDVYSFGVVLLELLVGRVLIDSEMIQWPSNSVLEERRRILRLSDASIVADVESMGDAMLACYKLGFSCASLVPQKRPSMKEALQVLEKIQ